ncbi:MAG: ABC-type transport auxiliary lipoprotein family protein [Oceanidesulfovibrio sp.]
MTTIRVFARPLPLALLAFALLAVGCVGQLSQPSPSKRYYTLNPIRDGVPLSVRPLPSRLKIRRLTASASFDSRELVYKLDDGGFVTDYYHLFLAPPVDQATQAMTRWFRDAKIFDVVLPPASGTESLYILETSMDELYADYSVDPPEAVVRLHAILMRDDGMEFFVEMDRAYTRRAVVEGQGAPAVVRSMEQALAAIFRELEQDVFEEIAASGR